MFSVRVGPYPRQQYVSERDAVAFEAGYAARLAGKPRPHSYLCPAERGWVAADMALSEA